jgi:transketolase
MLEINSKNARLWAKLGSRAIYGQAILALAIKTKKPLMVLSADLGRSSGLGRFIEAYPDNYKNVGIAEQNLIGVAAGFAKEGFVVFASSFAPFIAMRASEQVRMNMGYMNLNVKSVALGGGVCMGYLGNSHYGIEDVAVMRSIPNITVVSPADCYEIIKTINAAAEFNGPIYIRLTGDSNTTFVYEEDYEFKIGKAVTLREGTDITLIAAGTMVYESLEAAKLLEVRGLSVAVVNMHTIKPLDYEVLDKACKNTKLIVTIEEHSIIGGLGGAVAEYKSTFANMPPQLTLGLPDKFDVVGEHRFLLDFHGLTAVKIAERVLMHFTKLALTASKNELI